MSDAYTRHCPICGKSITHNNRYYGICAERDGRRCRSCSATEINLRPGMRDEFVTRYATKGANTGEQNAFFGRSHTEEVREKIRCMDRSHFQTEDFRRKMSDITAGKKNPMFGRTVQEVWEEKYGIYVAQEKLRAVAERISTAKTGEKNPMFGRPAPQGSGNGWSGWFKGVYFRSLRELSFMVSLENDNETWKTGEAAGLRINYTDWRGRKRTYVPDFLLGLKVFEIKPRKLFHSPSVVIKRTAAEQYCAEHGLEYCLVDPKPLSNEEIRKLRDEGEIKFLDRYEVLYQERYN